MPNTKTKELDTAKETLLNDFINWGLEIEAKVDGEEDSIIKLRAVMVNTEPSDEFITFARSVFVLSDVDTSKCDNEEEIDYDEIKDLEYHIPVKNMKETADETREYVLDNVDMVLDINFKAFKEKKDLMDWATDLN